MRFLIRNKIRNSGGIDGLGRNPNTYENDPMRNPAGGQGGSGQLRTILGRDMEEKMQYARYVDSLGGGNFVRALDTIGGGNFVRNLDSIGGANFVKRTLDSLGGANFVKRTLDTIGGPNLVKRYLDTLGGGNFV